jgi:hypothetical protein
VCRKAAILPLKTENPLGFDGASGSDSSLALGTESYPADGGAVAQQQGQQEPQSVWV